jgi:hypothetical protein
VYYSSLWLNYISCPPCWPKVWISYLLLGILNPANFKNLGWLHGFQFTRWGFPILCYYLHHFKLRDEIFISPLFTHLISSYMRFSDCMLHRFELWSSHIFLDLLWDGQSSINRAGVVKRLENYLSPSSAFNLFISFNHETLKNINRQGFPLGVIYYRFPLTHEIIHSEFSAI